MTFPTFSAALRALEDRHPHLLSLPMNDPLIRHSFEEVERQQLQRVQRAVAKPDDDGPLASFTCASCDTARDPVLGLETWTELWVHLMSCRYFRAHVAQRA